LWITYLAKKAAGGEKGSPALFKGSAEKRNPTSSEKRQKWGNTISGMKGKGYFGIKIEPG